jgi:soluble lytic murein transglycosylase-like protein
MCYLLGLFLCIQASNTMATPVNNCSAEDIKAMIFAAEIQHEIPEGLLAAIAKVESGNRAYAVNLGGRSIYASSFAEASSTAKAQIKSGTSNIDLGVMQLNYRWHGKQFANIEEMLTPKNNINYAAGLLKGLYNQHGNWQKAIRHYHSANLEHSRRYSRKVTVAWLGSK